MKQLVKRAPSLNMKNPTTSTWQQHQTMTRLIVKEIVIAQR
jgi:hypothetical protein